MRGRAVWGVALWVAMAACWPRGAQAHGAQGKFIDLELLDDNRVQVHVAIDEPSVQAAMELWSMAEAPPSMFESLRQDYLVGSLELKTPGGACAAQEPPAMGREDRDGRSFVTATRVYGCDARRPIHFADGSAALSHGVMVSVHDGSRTVTRFLTDGAAGMDVTDVPRRLTVIRQFLWAGSIHLATGYDHILFLFSLLLGIVALPSKQEPKQAFRMAAIVISAFTLGHSVTLIPAALGVIPVSGGVVECLIAASIIYVALVNVIAPSKAEKHPWLGFIFGLVHGLGFSSALAETGLPAQGRVIALLSFNVGIEAAQLVVAAAALVPLFWMLRRPRGYKVAVVGGSLAIAGVATIWLIERIIGVVTHH